MHDTPQAPVRWRAARIVAAIAFSLAALAVPLSAEAPARASTHGAGEYESGHWHGNYVEGGAYAYCLDYHLDWDGGLSPTWAGTVTTYGSLTSVQLASIGAVVAAIGQTGDQAEARAIADAIWYVTDGIVPVGPTAPRAQQVIDWMAAWAAAPDSGTVAMSITTPGPGPRDAVLWIDTVTPGPSVTGMIQLTDGIFADTGSDTLVGEFSPGQTFAVIGAPSTGSPYRIRATLTGTSTLSTYSAAPPVYSYGPGYQGMVGPTALAIIPMTGSAQTADALSAVVLSTRTDAVVPAGTGVRDTAIIDDHGAGVDLAGWTVGFDLYEFPASGDGAVVPVCTPETLVFSSVEIPIAAAGEYVSDAYPTLQAGAYGWIATLYDATHTAQLVGVCGDPDETLRVDALLAVTGDASGTIGLTLAGGLALGGAGLAAAAANERRRKR